jgi:hypothetical protein
MLGLFAATAGALLLRMSRLDGFITYYPDTYAQLRAVDNLLAADFPISYIYPPGVALALAPLFAFLPDTLAAMQTAVLIAGLALIVVSFLFARAWTGDESTAWLLAVCVAFAAPFVFFSRVLWFDGINTLLIVLSLLLAPSMSRRPLPAQVAYSMLLFATVTVRYTNVIILPAVFIASMPDGTLSTGGVGRHLKSRVIIVSAATIAVLYGVYLVSAWDAVSRFSNGTSGSVLGMGGYVERLGQYVPAALLGYADQIDFRDAVAAVTVGALALGGALRLWQLSRQRTIAVLLAIALWLPIHALYIAFDDRYAMPAFFLVLFLAAYGLAGLPAWWRTLDRPWQRVGTVTGLAIGLAFFTGQHLAMDLSYLIVWPRQVEQSREPAYDVIREELRTLDGPSSVVISSQALAIDRNGVEVYDLIPHSGSYGIDKDSLERLLDYVRTQQDEGMTVYYHYTEYEEVGSDFLIYEEGYDAYFEGVVDEFRMREVASADHRAQRLYRLEHLAPAPLEHHH